MNRKLRRLMERREKQERTVRMTPAERNEIVDKATETAWLKILPVFLLYLVEHYRCKGKGIERFMEWFNAMEEWVDADPRNLDRVAKEILEKTGVELTW